MAACPTGSAHSRLAFAPCPDVRPDVGCRALTRGLVVRDHAGTRETLSPDVLSMLMFQADYLTDLMEIGEADADARAEEIAAFIEPGLEPVAHPVQVFDHVPHKRPARAGRPLPLWRAVPKGSA